MKAKLKTISVSVHECTLQESHWFLWAENWILWVQKRAVCIYSLHLNSCYICKHHNLLKLLPQSSLLTHFWRFKAQRSDFGLWEASFLELFRRCYLQCNFEALSPQEKNHKIFLTWALHLFSKHWISSLMKFTIVHNYLFFPKNLNCVATFPVSCTGRRSRQSPFWTYSKLLFSNW